MLTSTDYVELHRHFIHLAGEVRVAAHRADLETELSGIALTLLAVGNIFLDASEELKRKERIVKRRNWFIGLLFVFLLTWGWLTVAAQEVTPVPTASATETTTPPVDSPTPALPPTTESPEDILGIVLETLFAGAATIGGSVFVTAVVGLLKMFIPARAVSGDTLKNVTSLVVWLVYSVAIKFGLGTQFEGFAAILAPILVTAAPLVGVLIGSAKLYLSAKAHNVPILGYQRPGPTAAYNPRI